MCSVSKRPTTTVYISKAYLGSVTNHMTFCKDKYTVFVMKVPGIHIQKHSKHPACIQTTAKSYVANPQSEVQPALRMQPFNLVSAIPSCAV
jgi:hypothetical protein